MIEAVGSGSEVLVNIGHVDLSGKGWGQSKNPPTHKKKERTIMKLTKEICEHLITAIALADESWRDNEDTHYLLPKSEEALKWIVSEAKKRIK